MKDEPSRPTARPGQIIVLGMHRSGTSATAGLLHACGAFVGGPGEIKVPSRVNPRGFFERWDVRAVCDGALEAAGAAWWKASRFDPMEIPTPVRQDLAARAGAVVAGLDRHPVWLTKDPRLCLTLPVFREHLAPGAVAVLVARHPLEIARSLQHRDGFPIEAGLALWEAYVTAALHHSAGMPQVVVRYSELVRDPAAAGRKLIQELTAAGVRGLSEPDFAEAIDPALHHHRQEELDDGPMTSTQQDLWNALSRGETTPFANLRLSTSARQVLEAFEAAQCHGAAQAEARP